MYRERKKERNKKKFKSDNLQLHGCPLNVHKTVVSMAAAVATLLECDPWPNHVDEISWF